MKPMLAVNAPSLDKIVFPVLASPKLDGVRCLVIDGKPTTRNGKPISNDFIRGTLSDLSIYNWLDGELVTLDKDDKIKGFNECSGDIRRSSGSPKFEFLVFDSINPTVIGRTFQERLDFVKGQIGFSGYAKLIPHIVCNTIAELEEFEQYCVEHGYEGVMIRQPHGPYKHGRSTAKEQYLLKVKRFDDHEMEVTGYEPLVRKDGSVDHTRAGKLIGYTSKFGEVKVGSGFTDEQRRHIVSHKHTWVGESVTFKYQPSGMAEDGKPRFPVFKGIRQEGT